MAPHSSTLARKIPWTEEPGGCSPWGHEESDTTERPHFDFSLSCIGKGNGNPLLYSCLENPRDGGARWAAVYGVAQSRTRLKRLSSSSSSRVICARSVFIYYFNKYFLKLHLFMKVISSVFCMAICLTSLKSLHKCHLLNILT